MGAFKNSISLKKSENLNFYSMILFYLLLEFYQFQFHNTIPFLTLSENGLFTTKACKSNFRTHSRNNFVIFSLYFVLMVSLSLFSWQVCSLKTFSHNNKSKILENIQRRSTKVKDLEGKLSKEYLRSLALFNLEEPSWQSATSLSEEAEGQTLISSLW